MFNKNVLPIIMGFLAITFILTMALKHAPAERKIGGQTTRSQLQDAAIEPRAVLPGKGEASESESSGPVVNLPWENESAFLEAQIKAQAPILMAAYKTVLLDPLPGEEENVHLGASLLKGCTVSPGQVFSQNSSIGPYSVERGFKEGPTYVGTQLLITTGGGVCKIASTLYNVASLSNLPIVERHAHGMPVPYVPYGQDATVSFGAKDLRFTNNTAFPILIWAEGIDNTLYIAFYGQEQSRPVEWLHQFEKQIKSYTIYHQNSQIPGGEERVAVEGMDGAVVRSWIKVYTEDGSWVLKPMGVSFYSPLPRVVERGTLESATTEP